MLHFECPQGQYKQKILKKKKTQVRDRERKMLLDLTHNSRKYIYKRMMNAIVLPAETHIKHILYMREEKIHIVCVCVSAYIGTVHAV